MKNLKQGCMKMMMKISELDVKPCITMLATKTEDNNNMLYDNKIYFIYLYLGIPEDSVES